MDRWPASTPAIAVADLRKAYGGIQALVGVDLAVEPGTVHAVVGENGAGKSTLMKILAGAVHPDQRRGPRRRRAGPAGVHRRMPAGSASASSTRSSASSRSGRSWPTCSPIGSRPGSVSWIGPRCAVARLRSLCAPRTRRRPGHHRRRPWHRRAAAGRAVPRADRAPARPHPRRAQLRAQRARDRPAVRGPARAVRRRHHDHLRLAPARGGVRDRRPDHGDAQRRHRRDRGPTGSDHVPRIVEAMVGTSPGRAVPATCVAPGGIGRRAPPPSLAVQGLTVGDELRDVSFEARPGEIIGLAGLEGSGVATLLGVLFGTRRATAGESRSPTAVAPRPPRPPPPAAGSASSRPTGASRA